MAKEHPPYAPEFRRQMIELVRAGRSPLLGRRGPARMLTVVQAQVWNGSGARAIPLPGGNGGPSSFADRSGPARRHDLSPGSAKQT